jgi:hypothetical protein
MDRNSVTNLEIQATNRKLNKIAKVYNNVIIIESNLHRKYFTQHGMHLNKHGKEWLSKQIATQIHRLVESNSKDTPIIPLKWKIEPISKQNSENPLLEQITTSPINPNKLDVSTVVETLTNSVPNRNRRLPITTSNDFLWQIITELPKHVEPQLVTDMSTIKSLNQNY